MPPLQTPTADGQERWSEWQLLETLRDSPGTLVVTGNARAARALRRQYSLWQKDAGRSGWASPNIVAWEPWLNNLWNDAVLQQVETRALLNAEQESQAWRSILDHDETAAVVYSIARLADLTRDAWREMCRYRISTRDLKGDDSVDGRAFARWAAKFDELCRKSGWLPPSLVEAAAGAWLSSGKLVVPEKLLLLGFDRLLPAQNAVIQALRTRGCEARSIRLSAANKSTPDRGIVFTQTVEEEIAAAAQWARDRLLVDPSQRIGIVAPASGKTQSILDSIFRRVLVPSAMDVRSTATLLPYEFSLGVPMRQLPEVRTALALLRWMERPLPPDELSWLLVHGTFEHPANKLIWMLERSKLDARFRRRKLHLGGPVSLATFRQWLHAQNHSDGNASLDRVLTRLSAAWERNGGARERMFGDWRNLVDETLDAAEWRLLKPASSRDFQLLERWNALLDRMSSLNSVSASVGFRTAMEELGRLADNTLFALQSHDAPVQVLGVAESAGLSFDAIWWMSARFDAWPLKGNAQPFLPWAVQRAAEMPYTNQAKDYEFALRVAERVVESADSIVISFAVQENTSGENTADVLDPTLLLSPTIRETLPEVPLTAAAKPFSYSTETDISGGFDALETRREESAVPLQTRHVEGGVKFLERQAACPFQAFAELRLAAESLEDTDGGFSPKHQGIAIHAVLQSFWNDVKTRSALLQLTREETEARVDKYIEQALANLARAATELWQQRLLGVESTRLRTRVLEWLDLEKNRPDFETITTEDKLTGELGGVEFDFRIDRIDRAEQGVALIDYKSGRVERKACVGDRPDSPQLPAYAVLRPETPELPLAGVAFASLHPQNVGFVTVASLPGVFQHAEEPAADRPGIKAKKPRAMKQDALTSEAMTEQQQEWKEALITLAEAFRVGAAIVDPKDKLKTCKRCGQAVLCRVRETDIPMADPDEENAEPDGDDSA